jgi:GT2 family glycosyltransferase
MQSFLSIIIVNYKTPDLTFRCIKSIVDNVSIDYEIIIVDNNSKDNSEELITTNFPKIKWINNLNNDGFGRANNIGIKAASGEFVLLLNSDMLILKGTIEACLENVKKDSNIGALGCKLLNEDQSLQKSVYYHIADFEGVLEKNLVYDYLKKPNKNKKPIKAIMGAFMLIPKKVFGEVGLFDPDFFMYGEEMELCHRISKGGYSINYFDEVVAIHKHGASSSNKDNAHKQNFLSTAFLFFKIRGISGYGLYHLIFIMNTITNFFVMWKLDAEWRKTSFWNVQRYYFSNFKYYLIIPFQFKRKIGNGKRILRRS